jgi:hypothetical protein
MYVWFKKGSERLSKYLISTAQKSKQLWKEELQMVDMYVALVINKRRTLSQVPLSFRDAVEADLLALGLDGNGDPIVTE